MPLNISMPTYVSEGQENENEAFASAAVRPSARVIRFHGECHTVIYFFKQKNFSQTFNAASSRLCRRAMPVTMGRISSVDSARRKKSKSNNTRVFLSHAILINVSRIDAEQHAKCRA